MIHDCEIPIIAVTDLEGDINKLSFKETPIFLGQSNTRNTSFCNVNAKSPYPGLNLVCNFFPSVCSCFAISAQNVSHNASILSVPMACSQSALDGDNLLYRVIKRSIPSPIVAANKIISVHPSKFLILLR